MHLVHRVTLKDSTVPGQKKLLLGEALPFCAWFTALVLEHACINVAVMHAGLTQTERSNLADKFNNAQSDLQVLILLADVFIVVLNLDLACSDIFIMTILRYLSQEIQLWGRIIRVGAPRAKVLLRQTDFPRLPLRRKSLFTGNTPNSHDDYRAFQQEDKIGVELATKEYQPQVRNLLIRLLNEHQNKVREAHNSAEGRDYITKMKDSQQEPLDSTDTEIISDYQAEVMPRNRQAPERFNIMAFDKHGRPKNKFDVSDYQCYEYHEGVDDEDCVELQLVPRMITHTMCRATTKA